jgi:hypothetical protein
MRKVPTYWFDNLSSVGIDRVPDYSQVVIENDGTGRVDIVFKVSNAGMTQTSTIQDFLANPALYQTSDAENDVRYVNVDGDTMTGALNVTEVSNANISGGTY